VHNPVRILFRHAMASAELGSLSDQIEVVEAIAELSNDEPEQQEMREHAAQLRELRAAHNQLRLNLQARR